MVEVMEGVEMVTGEGANAVVEEGEVGVEVVSKLVEEVMGVGAKAVEEVGVVVVEEVSKQVVEVMVVGEKVVGVEVGVAVVEVSKLVGEVKVVVGKVEGVGVNRQVVEAMEGAVGASKQVVGEMAVGAKGEVVVVSTQVEELMEVGETVKAGYKQVVGGSASQREG